MNNTQLIAFFVLAVASVASAIGVISFKNAVHCALSLILTLLFLALFYLQLGAMFIAVVQILIYAGAIMVLFATLGLILVGALSYLLFTGAAIDASAKASGANRLSQVVTSQGDTQAFGLALFHGFAFPFEVTSLLIVVALLGAMVLGRRG